MVLASCCLLNARWSSDFGFQSSMSQTSEVVGVLAPLCHSQLSFLFDDKSCLIICKLQQGVKFQTFGDFLTDERSSICKVLVRCWNFAVLNVPSWWLIMFDDLQPSTRCSSFKTSVTFWLMSAHWSAKFSTGAGILKFWKFLVDEWSCFMICKVQQGVQASFRTLVTFLTDERSHRSAKFSTDVQVWNSECS